MNEQQESCTVMEAAKRLDMSHRTFSKWAKRLDIHSHQHPCDLRCYMVYLSDVERIREARRLMPTALSRGDRTV